MSRSTSLSFETRPPSWAQAYIDRATEAESKNKRLEAENVRLVKLLEEAHELVNKVKDLTSQGARYDAHARSISEHE